jgi:hypothetical protein
MLNFKINIISKIKKIMNHNIILNIHFQIVKPFINNLMDNNKIKSHKKLIYQHLYLTRLYKDTNKILKKK